MEIRITKNTDGHPTAIIRENAHTKEQKEIALVYNKQNKNFLISSETELTDKQLEKLEDLLEIM